MFFDTRNKLNFHITIKPTFVVKNLADNTPVDKLQNIIPSFFFNNRDIWGFTIYKQGGLGIFSQQVMCHSSTVNESEH